MHYNTGYHVEAVPPVRRFVKMFADAEAVCVPSASCVAMMREHYKLIAEREKDAEFLAEVRSLLPRVFEFSVDGCDTGGWAAGVSCDPDR